MKKLLLIVFCIICINASAQQDNIWYFGQRAGIDFGSGGLPESIIDSEMATEEACSAVSDADGNLLFYSNIMTVWNRNHQVMENVTGLPAIHQADR